MIYIKTNKEIDLIRESCKIVAETLQLLKSNVKPGITTLELDKIAEDYIKSNPKRLKQSTLKTKQTALKYLKKFKKHLLKKYSIRE